MITFHLTSSRYKKNLLFIIIIFTLTLVSPLSVMASETNVQIETVIPIEADSTELQLTAATEPATADKAAVPESTTVPEPATESEAGAETETQKQYVYDTYGLFSDKELDSLTAACIEYSEEAKADIIMIATATLDGKTPKQYMMDFYDEMGFGYNEELGDTVMLLVNMEEDNRWVEIQGYGKAEYYVNNDRIEYMLDDITKILKEGNYKDAFVEFAKQSAYYMNESKGVKETPASGSANSGSGNYGESGYNGPSDYYGEEKANPLYNTVVQLVIAFIIGAISVGVMAASSGGRMTAKGNTYLDEGRSGVLDSRDDYMRTTTTRVKKPSNNDGGGRSSGGGGVSSGGHSHSGGGRSF